MRALLPRDMREATAAERALAERADREERQQRIAVHAERVGRELRRLSGPPPPVAFDVESGTGQMLLFAGHGEA